jgi:hypothetical protein
MMFILYRELAAEASHQGLNLVEQICAIPGCEAAPEVLGVFPQDFDAIELRAVWRQVIQMQALPSRRRRCFSISSPLWIAPLPASVSSGVDGKYPFLAASAAPRPTVPGVSSPQSLQHCLFDFDSKNCEPTYLLEIRVLANCIP